MENKKDPIESLFDENDTSVITLYNEKNEPIEFEQIAVIPLDEEIYAILQPVILPEGASEDEALVFILNEEEQGVSINLIQDDSVIDAVFEKYYELIKEQENKQENK